MKTKKTLYGKVENTTINEWSREVGKPSHTAKEVEKKPPEIGCEGCKVYDFKTPWQRVKFCAYHKRVVNAHEALVNALREYGRHTRQCDFELDRGVCTCGFGLSDVHPLAQAEGK